MKKEKKRSSVKILIAILLIFAVNWLIIGWLVYQNMIPQSTLRYVLLGSGIINFLFLGFLLANRIRKKGFLVGLGVGIIVCLVILLVATLGYETVNSSLFVKLTLYAFGSSLGGAIGVNFKQIV